MRWIDGIESFHPYRGTSSLRSLEKAIRAVQPTLLIPCDDGVVWQLHQLFHSHPDLRPLIEASLGSAAAFPVLSSRAALLTIASDLNIRIPATIEITSPDALESWPDNEPAVLKLDGTWGGTGVVIAHSIPEQKAAFHKLSLPISTAFAWKHLFINRDPLALWALRSKNSPKITLQQFVPGHPANIMFACWRGTLLASVTVEALATQGATGAATVVRILQNQEIETAARLLARKLDLSGFYGLDFILEQNTGKPFLLELNPRCTQLGHLCLPRQGDLAGFLAAAIMGTKPSLPPPEECIPSTTVAFFPQAVLWNPHSEYLRTGFHDVPWQHPGLLRDLLLGPWPRRQLRSRIYHRFRPDQRTEEVRYEADALQPVSHSD